MQVGWAVCGSDKIVMVPVRKKTRQNKNKIFFYFFFKKKEKIIERIALLLKSHSDSCKVSSLKLLTNSLVSCDNEI